jgi:hypothetical protein
MRDIDRQLISEEDISVAVQGRSESEIESEIKAAQVQSFQTKYDAKNIANWNR